MQTQSFAEICLSYVHKFQHLQHIVCYVNTNTAILFENERIVVCYVGEGVEIRQGKWDMTYRMNKTTNTYTRLDFSCGPLKCHQI